MICEHGYTWYCPKGCPQTMPTARKIPEIIKAESWRECGACFDLVAMRRTEKCPEHGEKQ